MESICNTCPICSKSSSKLCSACRIVSYCSVEHQKQDWKEHRKLCRPFLVKKNEIYGRYIVAARDIPAGTIIMNEPAITIGPKQNTRPICLGCHKKVDGSYRCSQCSFPMCNKNCEKVDIHSNNECKIFRKNSHKIKISNFNDIHPAYECILTVRCLMLKESDPKRWERLKTMEPHNEIRKQLSDLWHRNEINTVKLLREVYKMEFDEMTIHTVLGYADVNAFEIRSEGIEICGLFPDVALMAHECISNTHHSITDDYRMIVRVTIPIKKGELITTTYTHTLDGTLDRRKYIKESKFFDCTCKRCADPTELGTYFSGIKCTLMSDCPGYLIPNVPLQPTSKWSCTECHHTLSVDQIEETVEKVRQYILEARKNGKVAQLIPLLEEILENISGKVLHPNHFLIIHIIHTLSQVYGRTNGWMLTELAPELLKRKEVLCRRLLGVIDIIEPGLSRIRGLTLYELHAPIYMLAQEEFQSKKITKDQLLERLTEVLGLLEISHQILCFDSASSQEGQIAKSIPETIEAVCRIRDHFC